MEPTMTAEPGIRLIDLEGEMIRSPDALEVLIDLCCENNMSVTFLS
jgi:hypothetical protein